MNINNLCIIALLFSLFSGIEINGQEYGYKPEKLPVAPHDSIFSGDIFSTVDRRFGFSGYDYSGFDFRNLSLDFLKYQAFDNHTKWPESDMLPPEFKPLDWLVAAKNPGLGIKELHREGITGKGVSVAIFDMPIKPGHIEIADNITYIPIHSDRAQNFQHKRIHFHGIACASILCGKRIGVAPDARLYYFAIPDDSNKTYSYCLALEKLLAINDTMPEDQIIRIVSISNNISSRDKKVVSRWESVEKRANASNIGIIYSSFNSAHRYFTWGGCPPYLDGNNPDNYDHTPFVIREDFNDYIEKILLPADFRTVADNRTDTTYNYSGESGFSWAIPYAAGLAALALQINPKLTLEDIFNYIDRSKSLSRDGKYVVNPARLIERVMTD